MNLLFGKIPPKSKYKAVAIDIEMFGQKDKRLHYLEGTLASVQICTGEDVYVLTEHKDIKKALENIGDAEYWTGHNLQYDIRQLRRWFTIEPRKIWDTMVMEQDLFGGYYDNFGLDDLVRRYLQIYMDKKPRELFSEGTELTDEMITYAAKDPYLQLKVMEAQELYIEDNGLDMKVYWDIDMWMTWVVLDIRPVKVDAQKWIVFVEEFEEKAQELEAALGFNSKSKNQVSAALEKRLGIKLKTTGKATLEELNDEMADDVIEARHYRDAVSKYGRKWVINHVDNNGFVRSSWNISGAATGRMASRDPNLQNIPSKAIKGYRDLFIESLGLMIIMDISAQEPRILACEAHDRALIKLFQEGGDPHLEAARAAFKDPTITADDPRRNAAKAISLGTSYGLTKIGLAAKLGCSEDEAEEFLDNYFKAHPDIKIWMNKQRAFAYKHWYVETRFGRRCWINMYTQSSDNNAINAPIQGGAADFTKMWMVKMWKECREKNVPYPVTMPVHDEIVTDTEKENKGMVEDLLMRNMKSVGAEIYPEVPWEGKIGSGPNWGSKE